MSLILDYHPLSSFGQKVLIMPLVDNYPTVAGYFERLKARPRVLQQAQPYLHLFPKERVA